MFCVAPFPTTLPLRWSVTDSCYIIQQIKLFVKPHDSEMLKGSELWNKILIARWKRITLWIKSSSNSRGLDWPPVTSPTARLLFTEPAAYEHLPLPTLPNTSPFYDFKCFVINQKTFLMNFIGMIHIKMH